MTFVTLFIKGTEGITIRLVTETNVTGDNLSLFHFHLNDLLPFLTSNSSMKKGTRITRTSEMEQKW